MTTFLIVLGVVLIIAGAFSALPKRFPIAYTDIDDIRYLPKKRSVSLNDLKRVVPTYKGQRVSSNFLKRYVTQGDLPDIPSGSYLYVAHDDLDFELKKSLVVTSRVWGNTKRFMLGYWVGKFGAGTYKEDIKNFPWIPDGTEDIAGLIKCAEKLFQINPGLREGCVIYVLLSGKPNLVYQPLEQVKGRVIFKVSPKQR